MAFWKKPLRLGLQARISLLAALGLVLIFTFMIWEERQIADANAEMVLQERLNLARVIAQHLDQDLDRTLSRLEQVAAFPIINLEDSDLEPEKAELRALYRPDYFSYVFLLDKDGLVLWTEPYLPEVVNREHLECPHVQETLHTGQAAIACIANALTPLSPVIAPVTPIRNRQGAIVGALGAAIDPSSPPFVSIFEGIAPGNTGYIQLVDENGIVLSHTEGRHLFQKSEHADLFISVLKDKKPVIAAYTVTEENKGTFRQVIAFAPLTAAPWGVAVEQDEAEFLAPSLEASRRMEFFAVTAMAVAFVLVWVTTLSVIRTVRKLMEASERIAAGDLSTPVAISGSDEVAELGRNFETMRRRLVSWGEELEAAVQNRTRQLSVLYAIDRAAAQSLELEEILKDALDKVLGVLEVEAGGIFLLEPDGETMTLRTHHGLSDEFVENVQRIHLGEGISGRAAAERQVVVLDVPDYSTERLAPFIVREGFQTLASTPLISAGELVGALNVGTCRPRAFPPEEMELLTSIGQQLGGAVANAQLHQETHQRAERLSLLNRIAHALSTILNLDELLEVVYREITTAIPTDAFFIALYDRDANELDFRIRVDNGIHGPPERQPLETGLTTLVVTDKKSLLIRDFEKEKEHLPPTKLWGTMQAPLSWLGVPMLLGDQVVGAISVQAYRPNTYGEAEQELLCTVADAVAVAIENARLYSAEQRRATRLDALQRLGIELATLREEGATLNTLVVRAAIIAESPACTVMLIDETTNEAVLAAQTGLPEGSPLGLRVPLTIPIIRQSLETGEPIIVPDIDRDAPELRQLLVHPGVRAFFAYPMAREGRAVGFITLSSLTPRTPSKEENTAYHLLAERAATALENARLYQGLEESKAALEAKVRDLERFTRLTVGRELRMKELKEKMRELEGQGSPSPDRSEGTGAEEQGSKGAGQ